METICAISTPAGSGAINIIRLSGKHSLPLALSLFSCAQIAGGKPVPRHFYLGNFALENGMEKCLMVWFQTPSSYTGEDMVEFQIHGGEFLAKKVLRTCLQSGKARQAEPGEFTKRAFLNGKVSLDEAEGIIDEISAESEAELSSAFALAEGKLQKRIRQVQQKLTECLAKCEVALDYPEHDDETMVTMQVENVLAESKILLSETLEGSEQARLFKEGIQVVIAGMPNVGKSSLLNALLGEDRAIVTSIAGTTRDTIREKIILHGVKFNLIDTAGLRESEDVIEKLGIQRTQNAIKEAALILFVLDATREATMEERNFINENKKNLLCVLNKIDESGIKTDISGIPVSAKTGEGIEQLKEFIVQKTISKGKNAHSLQLTNERHIGLILSALAKIDRIKAEIGLVPTMDVLVFQVKQLWTELGKITGETEDENIINEIFSRFCLGK